MPPPAWKPKPLVRPRPECRHDPYSMAYGPRGARCGECGLVWAMGQWSYEFVGEQPGRLPRARAV